MKKHLKVHYIEPHTDEWYAFRREKGIGGSEVGTVLGINKYDTSIRLFHEKIGTIEPKREQNNRMFWGHINEEVIANIWQYYDNTETGYVENYRNNKIIRKCRKVQGYVTNPKYPWLFASVDRLINKETGVNFITGEPLVEEGILEIKNMGYWMSQIWQDGIPIYHLAQIHVYMAILETDYAEIALLVDGAELRVEKIQQDKELTERIIEITKRFWYDKVLPAREAKKKKDLADTDGNIREAQKQDAAIQRLEPDPDQSEAYKDYMEENFLKEREIVEGNMELFELAKRDVVLRSLSGLIKNDRTYIKNCFIKFMNDNGSDTVDFGKYGSVSWLQSKSRATRTFKVSVKEKPDEGKLEEEYNKMNKDLL